MSDVEPCTDCGREHEPGRPVTWSPAYQAWLCTNCRSSRTDTELAATRQANLAAKRETS